MKELWFRLVMSVPGADMDFVGAYYTFFSYLLSPKLTWIFPFPVLPWNLHSLKSLQENSILLKLLVYCKSWIHSLIHLKCFHVSLCICLYQCVCTHIFAYICGNQRSVSSAFLDCFPPYLFFSSNFKNFACYLSGLTLNLQLANSARLTGWSAVSRNLPISTSQILRLQAYTTVPGFYVGSGGSNSGIII